jgi:enoyl-CoA hydratase
MKPMPEIIVDRADLVTTLTLNRPERLNAMTPPMFALLEAAWRAADDDPNCRVLVVTGAEGNFSSGMDLRGVASEQQSPGAEAQSSASPDLDLAFRALLKTYRPSKPVIAAVEGVAIGGGTELLLGTDIRVAGASARFGLSEARWSLYPAAGSAVRLPRQVPYTIACEMLLTGKHIDAAEAARIGLVGSVVPAGGALQAAHDIAAAIAANGPLAVSALLRTLRETRSMREDEAFAFEQRLMTQVHSSQDAREGPRAFAEKRTPSFRGI